MLPRIRRNVQDVFFRCMLTRDRNLKKYTPVILQQQLDLSLLLQVIQSVMNSILLSLSLWNSLNLLSSLLSSLRLRLDRARWVKLLPSWQKKILLSVLIQIRKQARQLLLVWVNYTLKLSQTDFFVNLRQKLTLVHLRLHTRKLLLRKLILIVSTLSSPVDVVSTVTVRLNSLLWMLTAKNSSSSNQQLLVVLFLRNTSLQLVKVLKKLLTLVFLVDSLLLVYMLTYMMVPTMKSIHQKWHSTLLVPLHSRKLCRRQHLYFLSLS